MLLIGRVEGVLNCLFTVFPRTYSGYVLAIQNWEELGVGNSLVVQWLGLTLPTAGVTGSVPGWGTKIPPAAHHGQEKEQKQKTKLGRVSCVLLGSPLYFYISCIFQPFLGKGSDQLVLFFLYSIVGISSKKFFLFEVQCLLNVYHKVKKL